LGNTCYHSVQSFWSSSHFPKNLEIKIHKKNSACCFVWVRNFISHTKGGT
jgi:hypothetical protein